MGFRGQQFTWKRGRSESLFIAKRLDRVLCCPHARLKWQEATVTHLPFLASDHAPLYVDLEPILQTNKSRRPFRFEAAWLTHERFKDLLTASWDSNLDTRLALKKLQGVLKRWNKEVFGNVQRRKEKLLSEILEVQKMIESNPTNELLQKESSLTNEFDVVLEQEEIIWYQKFREKLLTQGDRNTKFFHTSTIIRRRKNMIEKLKDEQGQWLTDGEELEKLVIAYYRRLYSLDDVEQSVEALPRGSFATLSYADKHDVQRQ